MDLPILLKALILGLVEGITEFLPVSSTGHLILTGQLLDFTGDKAQVFEVAIQLAAIFAVVWEYRARLGHVVASMTREPISQRFALNLFVAFLPAAVLGLLFLKQIKFYLFNPFVVASTFILGGLLILWAERRQHVVRVQVVEEMRWQDALKVGFAQALAMIPGTSRSGATIIGGRRRGGGLRLGLPGGARPDPVHQPPRFHPVRLVPHRLRPGGAGDALPGADPLGGGLAGSRAHR